MIDLTPSARRNTLLVGLGWIFLGLVLLLGLSRAAAPKQVDTRGQGVEVSADLAALRSELDSSQASVRELRARVRELEQRLVASDTARMEREQEFLKYTEMIVSLVPPEAPPEILLALTGEVPESSLPAEDTLAALQRAADKERADEIALALRSLMFIEQFDSLDLLEIGTLGDGWVGPVVFRIIDEHGRPSGSLCADRLRLEGSRTGWTVTFVFEDGYERRAGQKVPFEGAALSPEGLAASDPQLAERRGVRRITLSQADPEPWIEALPELFDSTAPVELTDDGQWQVLLVRQRLNKLLSFDASHGYYRVRRLGGVVDGVLRDVELQQLTQDGEVTQRLVADRLTLEEAERGMSLTLRDGVLLKAGRKLAFLDGRYRIFLPRAKHEQWRAAGLPGLVEAEDSSAGSAAPLSVR